MTKQERELRLAIGDELYDRIEAISEEKRAENEARGSIECLTLGCKKCGAEACWNRDPLTLIG